MKRFIKKQLLRSWNIIKGTWEFMLFEFIEDGDFTTFGKYFIGVAMTLLLIIYTAALIVTMPLLLCILKYDDSIGM